jgi:hypothetical protein
MENIIFYTDRYQAVNLIEKESTKFVNIVQPTTADLDSYIQELIVNKELINKQYKNIYIPLSPFSAFTDYLGLRIALYIKLSDSKSKLSNIFIYGSDGAQDFINNECSEILTFQEVSLIDFSKEAINKTLTNDLSITEDIWFQQINSIGLHVPDDYFDSHSVANEWGIYQMARNADIKIEEIEGIDLDKFKRLYFKWLIFKNKLNESIPEEQKEEQKRYAERLKGATILGTIDLSKFKKK